MASNRSPLDYRDPATPDAVPEEIEREYQEERASLKYQLIVIIVAPIVLLILAVLLFVTGGSGRFGPW
jgi:hypothetical protein